MYRAFRAASRRASSDARTINSSAAATDAFDTASQLSAATAALLMAALVASASSSDHIPGRGETGDGELRDHAEPVVGGRSDLYAAFASAADNDDREKGAGRSFVDRLSTTMSTAAVAMTTSLSSPRSAAITACEQAFGEVRGGGQLKRALTSRRLAAEAAKRSFFTLYEVDFDDPLGSGAYGDVYLCREIMSGEKCALKKIPKEFTEHVEFQREMNALMHIRAHGGHPNICMLRENFDEQDDYMLVLDLIDGKEMFDYLIEHGAYSEADASRLIRQVASAMDYIHGVGVIHADLKPENIMIQSTRWSDAVIKLIDFGCSAVLEVDVSGAPRTLSHEEGSTTAYCPPEAFDDEIRALDPSADMWALGVILYTMLLGRHPFDLDGDASNEEVGRRIKEQRQPPLHDCPFAGHLSPSALDLLSKLMEPDPAKRLTAHDMLHHPWVTGETARRDVMEDSAARLKIIQNYRSGIEKTVIESLISFSEDRDEGQHEEWGGRGVSTDNNKPMPSEKRTSLLERAFDRLDTDHKGFLSTKDLKSLHSPPSLFPSSTPPAPLSLLEKKGTIPIDDSDENSNMSFNHFSDVVGEKMRSMHFPKGQVIYREGDDGNYMYFINSGAIEVSTQDGFRAKKGQGDYFGKSGVLGRPRRTTITCTTPINVLVIDKDHFKKHVVVGSPLGMKLREKINTEKFDRAEKIIKQDADMKQGTHRRGDMIFEIGDKADKTFIVKEGTIDITCNDHHIYSCKPGHLFGAQSKDNVRVTTATCDSRQCVVNEIAADEFERVLNARPDLKNTIRELALRQEFRRAVVVRRRKSFRESTNHLREVFDEIDLDHSGTLDPGELRRQMEVLGAAISDEEINQLFKTLDLNESGDVNFAEFQRIFGSTS